MVLQLNSESFYSEGNKERGSKKQNFLQRIKLIFREWFKTELFNS